MASVSVTIDDRALRRKLEQAIIMLGPTGGRGLMRAIGAVMKRSTLDKFKAETDGSNEWEPLKPDTIAGRRDVKKARGQVSSRKTATGRSRAMDKLNVIMGDVKILQDTGTLRRSVEYDADNMSVEIGSDLHYGIFHQLGAPRAGIPERAFITLSDADYRRLSELTDRYLQRVFA